MKFTPRRVLFSCLFIFSLIACSKHSNPDVVTYSYTGTRTGTVVFSHNSLQKGQPLVVSLSGGSSASIKWTVDANPATVHIEPSKGQATILFARPGSFRVTATSVGADNSVQDSSWKVIHVCDTVYQPVPTPDTTSLAGDQITITPSVDSIGNLLLLAQTKNSYGCSSSLVWGLSVGPNGEGGIGMNFYEVISNGTGTCNGVQNPASVYLFPGATGKWANGTYPMTAWMNGITYSGTLTITNTSYSFSWSYSSGVLISPLQINK
ncbi:hypothetical protein [Puia dinghuensis]|uniref:PKD domain-containing protein n=1 Tax=Puia dinghuensis TaxID=1792502 RepID=A0A8J2UCN1_9BACT|nr:hypothetical protein [Puia dinghuensis]GGA98098.1 hypothetical protein GCM10011511_21750 [Puia dinghuensis]